MNAPVPASIGYTFSNPALFAAAMTHASVQSGPADNERLEFLGDRVLALVVADLLFTSFPDEAEGELAKRHTGLVQQKALADVAKSLGIAAHLTLSPGEQKAGGHQKDRILADAMEALIGAIYLDGGFAPAKDFIGRCWRPLMEAQELPPEDAKSRLQEWAQGRGLPLPSYDVVGRSGEDHAPVFEIEVVVEGAGRAKASATNKRAAEKEAARLLMEKIDGR